MTNWKLIGSNLEAYQFQSDEHETVLESKSINSDKDYAGLRGTPDLIQARGKRLEFSAFIRTESVTSAGLWLMANAKTFLVNDSMYDCLLSGTHSWTPKFLVIDVPVDAKS